MNEFDSNYYALQDIRFRFAAFAVLGRIESDRMLVASDFGH
jgi:hypothetical protein